MATSWEQNVSRLRQIHEENFSRIDSVHFDKTLQLVASEYGYGQEHPLPDWFDSMLSHVLHRTKAKVQFRDIDSRIWSFIAELQDTLGWLIDDQGEGLIVSFPAYDLTAYISLEGWSPRGESCCFFEIMKSAKRNS